ncbi:MAG TPA: molybdopterin-dependent oxidoreductase [Blastocatellia bacterium]|jgi:anaerobic selenocysteine-containing dehydrogenase|nr:molybdopterin-dependent oxidoreductase [Blastocatellia bacterium]
MFRKRDDRSGPKKPDESQPAQNDQSASRLSNFPPYERWDDWVEYDAKRWPEKVERRYSLVPTICFNCESACGLLAYVDQDTGEIKKLEGNPLHPGSRGRNCAKGPATINQIHDPERILFPLKRVGARGEGRWERTTWDEVLDTFAERIRKALVENRRDEVIYHVGRPGHDGYIDRVLQAWGVDGHNSHTNICSSSARVGYALWQGADRPSPDYANARFILLLSSHLETGHYFNPHAQRIIEGRSSGAKIAVVDPRLSNTASMANYWLSPYPGTEAALLLAMASVILREDRYDKEFMRRWVNWEDFLRNERPELPSTFDSYIEAIKELYSEYTPEFAATECGVEAEKIVTIAREIASAGSRFASHVWRSAASGNLGGWQVARALMFLNALTGSIGTEGGVSPNVWNKFVAAPFSRPAPQKTWNEVLWPREYPLAHHEMSFLFPHFLKQGRGHVSAYFTRVYNPVWTNPDGMTWIEVLRDESKIELHAALTPVWSETAWFADYVLPMGVGAERHDLQSQETHSAQWVSFRQPVARVWRERRGEKFEHTYEANPGEVWEEDEFWIELSWRIDPTGELGVRKHFESPYRPGNKISVEEYYRWIFENSIPGLPEKAAGAGLSPLDYMRRHAAFSVKTGVYKQHETPLPEAELEDTTVEEASGRIVRRTGSGEQVVGVMIDGSAVRGFTTPSRKLEFYSKTMADWKWPEHALPGYIRSHVHWRNLDREKGEYILVPTFRLPTLIHTRSGNAKWLYEISHTNPLWLNPKDSVRLGLQTGDLARVSTEIGYFVVRVWVTEGIRPGVVACSHHLGRWRLKQDEGTDRWASALVDLEESGDGRWRLRQIEGVKPFKSEDPDSGRVWWQEGGVHQNLTFPVHPDPVSGMHCWHQQVRIEKAGPDDRYGDVMVDTNLSFEVFRSWLEKARPAPGPDGLRRPLWFSRPVRPDNEAYIIRE